MNHQNIVVLSLLLFLFICAYALEVLKKKSFWKKEILEHIKLGHVLHVEIIKGPYRVIEKHGGDRLSLIRVENGRDVGYKLNVVVPIRLYERLTLRHVYYFYYDYKEHLICFHNESRHTEKSCLSEDYMRRDEFLIKTSVLEKLNR